MTRLLEFLVLVFSIPNRRVLGTKAINRVALQVWMVPLAYQVTFPLSEARTGWPQPVRNTNTGQKSYVEISGHEHWRTARKIFWETLVTQQQVVSRLMGSKFVEALSRAGLSTLEARRNVAQCAVVRKAFLGRHPGHLQKVIARWVLQSTTGSQRQSPRRNRFQVKLPRPKKVKFKLSPLYYAASTWNTLIHSHTANKTLPSMRDISNFFLTWHAPTFWVLIF